jgi:hypothetical protein
MPQAWYVSNGYYTAGGAGNAPATSTPGDTFNVPAFNVNSPAYLENIWCQGGSQDWISVKSPKMHDNNQGIRLRVGGTQVRPLLPDGAEQILYPVDTPTVTLDETAAATGAIALLYRFTDLPGIAPRMANWSDIQPRIKQISRVDVSLGGAAGIGQYSAGNAINSTLDNFQANSDYALLGYLAATAGLTLAISGIDTGNVKVGGPLSNDPIVTYNWFKSESLASGFPMIPIIAANNKASTLVYQVSNTAIAAQVVTLIFALLG